MESSLVLELTEASKQYYTTGKSHLSDEDYDAKINLLAKIDPSNPFLRTLCPNVKTFKVAHFFPMGTLRKVYDPEDVKKWLLSKTSQPRGGQILVSPKYDGFGVELVYIDGVLKSASTRGTGTYGEDILEAVKLLNVPLQINKSVGGLIVRGEAIIPLSKRSLFEKEGYKSLRNTVPGLVKAVDRKLLPHVDFVAYGVYAHGSTSDRFWTNSPLNDRILLDKLGFHVEDYRVCDSYVRVEEVYTFIRDNVGTYEFDGVVLKDNSHHTDEDLTEPLYQVAWKFDSKVKTTVLRGFEYQVGMTGKFTPIAAFDPVEFQGATLTRASVGSFARYVELLSKGMKIGSYILVTRQGDIIPYVKEVTSEYEGGVGTDLQSLTRCPFCDHEVSMRGKECFCSNPSCSEVLTQRVTSYVQGLKIKGLGKSAVAKMIEVGYVQKISDLYETPPESLRMVSGFGDSFFSKLKELQIKKIPVESLLPLYPMDNCGETVWKKLFSADPLLVPHLIQGVSTEFLSPESVKGIGGSRLEEILSQLENHRDDLVKIIQRASVEFGV